MKKFLLAGVLCFVASMASAQVVTRTLAWEEPETQAVVSTFITTVKIDASAAVQVSPTYSLSTNPQTPNGTHAQTPINLTPGTHVITVTVTNPSGLSASGGVNYNPGVAPSAPISVTVTVTVTVP